MDPKTLVTWSAVLFLTIGFTGYLVVVFYATSGKSERLSKLIFSETAYNIGLPTCVLTAFSVVISLEAFAGAYGNIKLELLGIVLEGAARPVVLWVVVYLSLVLSMRVLRRPKP